MPPTLRVTVVLHLFVFWAVKVRAKEDWSPEFLSQTREVNCIPGHLQYDVTFLHGTESGNFKKLGKVADMDVCMLLCCEMNECEAAFMADKKCYAVKCHSQEHCVTAPARNNRWHPVVAFVKRTGHLGPSIAGTKGQPLNIASNEEKVTDPRGKIPVKPNIKQQLKPDGQSGAEKNQQQIKEVSEKKSSIPGVHVAMNSLTIPAGSISDSVQLEELPKKPSGINDHSKNARRQREIRKAKFSIISAAVATCLMAFLLSGMAVIAAKIRRRREMSEGHEEEYSSVPAEE